MPDPAKPDHPMKPPKFRCPVCRKPVARDAEAFPFCSDRCKRIDLGHWATGDYRIPGDPVPEQPDSDDV
ncbi:MAG TPA: DNA gyrase inhibitor YacG [Mariprofundaceae bacterium]|nr:DNA gyrase inhibitor YacG [Mariprofundaceae bacterium]